MTGVWVEHHRGATAGRMRAEPERAVRLGQQRQVHVLAV